MASRTFSRAVSTWLGYSREKLSPNWKAAVEKFTEPGGSAEKKVGAIDSVEIKSRTEGPVHKSHFNPKDKADVISAKIKGENDTKTCHIYEDGTGTTKKGDERD